MQGVSPKLSSGLLSKPETLQQPGKGRFQAFSMCAVSHLGVNASLPPAKHSPAVKLSAHSTRWKAKTSTSRPLPTPAGSLRGWRGREVVLLVLHPGQPVGGLSSSSLERQERCVPRRPRRQPALTHRSDKYQLPRDLSTLSLSSEPIFQYSTCSWHDLCYL